MRLGEGPGSALHSGNEVEVFRQDVPPPSYPAVMFYDPVTDEPYWVECHDEFTIHLSRIRNEAAQRVIEGDPAPKPLAEYSSDWSTRLFDAVTSRGITFRHTEPNHDGARIGTHIMIGEFVRNVNTQLHIDYPREITDIQTGIELLADCIVIKLREQKDLYCCKLFLPSKGAEAVALERGEMRARALRSVCGQWDRDDKLVGVFPITRVDVLFPTW